MNLPIFKVSFFMHSTFVVRRGGSLFWLMPAYKEISFRQRSPVILNQLQLYS